MWIKLVDHKTFEPGQIVRLTDTNEVGMVTHGSSGSLYDIRILGVNNKPTNIGRIINASWLEPYNGEET